MKKLLFLFSLFALASAHAQSFIPARMVRSSFFNTVSPTTNLLQNQLAWIDQYWPTNINIAANYWTLEAGKSFVTTQGYASMASMTSSFVRGTNITGFSYNPTNSSWAPQGLIPVDMLVMTNTDGIWTFKASTNFVSQFVSGWSVEVPSRGLLEVTGGRVTAPTGYVAAITGSGWVQVRASTDDVSDISGYLQIETTSDNSAPEETVVGIYLRDAEDASKSRADGGSTFYTSTDSGVFQVSTYIYYNAGTRAGNDVVKARWRRLAIVLYPKP